MKMGAFETAAKVLTDKLLAMMGTGTDKAQLLWHNKLQTLCRDGMPYNEDNGRLYSGGNVLSLLIAKHERGFTSNGWITLTNMQKRGYTIVKGCKNPWAWVLSPMMVKEREKPDGTKEKYVTGYQKAYRVFNMDCVDTQGKLPRADRLTLQGKADEAEPTYSALNPILEYHKPNVRHIQGNQAYYQPRADRITLPLVSQFTSEASYYHVLAHELSHWTGHDDRLARDLTKGGGFGSADYAFEELIAELSAAFVMGHMKLGESQLPNHANYLKSWIKALKDDHTFIMKAMTKATRASSYLLTPILEAEEAAQD